MTKLEPLEFTLEDIFEDFAFKKGKLNDNKAEKVIENNIIYTLKREKLWNSNLEVAFKVGHPIIVNIEDNFYQCDYNIYDKELRDYVGHGVVYGHGLTILDNDKGELSGVFEVASMTLELHNANINRLKNTMEKEKVLFT